MKPLIHAPITPIRLGRARVRAAVLASVLALSCVLPISAAAAEGSPSGNGVLSLVSVGGGASELTSKVTLTQLAELLKISPTELVAQIEALPGNGAISLLLNGLIANPNATLQNVLGELTANGLNTGLVEQLLNALLAPALTNSGQLQGVIATLLSDLGIDGQLGSLATQLNVPVSALEHVGLLPISDESLAGTLDTTIDHLGSLLHSAGAINLPLSSVTPLVVTPVSGSGGGATEIVGVPTGTGGVSLTTINSTSPGQAGATGAAGAGAGAAVTPISNAFSIVSIKLTSRGSIVETVKVPSAGRLTVKATATGSVASAASRGSKKTARKSIKIAPGAANVAGGTRMITLHPARLINRANHIVVSLTTSYAPKGAAASTKHSAVTFKGRTRSKQGS